MRKRLLVLFAATALGLLAFTPAFSRIPPASAQNQTFTDRAAFEAATGKPLLRENFDAVSNGQQITSLFGGLVTFGSPPPTVFFGDWGVGVFAGGALIPEPRFQSKSLTITFPSPICGIGADTYDDRDGEPVASTITLTVTTRVGEILTISEDKPPSGNTGFLGGRSSQALISKAEFSIAGIGENLEVDNLTVDNCGHAGGGLPNISSKFRYPLDTTETPYMRFGVPIGPLAFCAGGYHNGVDYHDQSRPGGGADVHAVADGFVVRRNDIPSADAYGRYVILLHVRPAGQTVSSLYAHLQDLTDVPSIGGKVLKGQVVGHEGNSGRGSGGIVHLHFELRKILFPPTGGCVRNQADLEKWFYDPDIFIPAHQ